MKIYSKWVYLGRTYRFSQKYHYQMHLEKEKSDTKKSLYEKHLNIHAWFRGGIQRPKTCREKINRFLFTTLRCFMIISVYVT